MLVSEIKPAPVAVTVKDIPKTGGLFSKTHALEVMADQVAMVHQDGKVTIHAPAGRQPETVDLKKTAGF